MTFDAIEQLADYQSLVNSLSWNYLHEMLLKKMGTERHFLYEEFYNIYDTLDEVLGLRDRFWNKHGIVSDDVAALIIKQLVNRNFMEYRSSLFSADSFRILI